MGAHFGELAKIRGIVYYKLSPYEQKAFTGVFQNGVPNLFRRFRSSVFRVVPREFGAFKLSSVQALMSVLFSFHRGIHAVRLGECRAPSLDPQEPR